MNPVISIPELLVLGIYYFVICFEGFPFFDFTDTAQQYCITRHWPGFRITRTLRGLVVYRPVNINFLNFLPKSWIDPFISKESDRVGCFIGGAINWVGHVTIRILRGTGFSLSFIKAPFSPGIPFQNIDTVLDRHNCLEAIDVYNFIPSLPFCYTVNTANLWQILPSRH